MAEVVWTWSALAGVGVALLSRGGGPPGESDSAAPLIEAVDRVALSPRLGRLVPEFGDENLREVIFQNYRIVYRIDRDRIGVVAVRHGAMLLPDDLGKLPWNLP